jgi:hypothetical protein
VWSDDSTQPWREFTGGLGLGPHWGNVYAGGSKIVVAGQSPILAEVDTANGKATSLLAPEEISSFNIFNPLAEARCSEDGSITVAMTRLVHVKKRGQPMQDYTLTENVPNVGAYHVLKLTADGSKAFLAHFNPPFVDLKFLWIMDVQTGALSPVDLRDPAGARIVVADKVGGVYMNQDFSQLIIHERPTTVTHYDRASKKAKKLFAGVEQHVATLAGQGNSTAVDMSGFSFQGRYVSSVLNVYSTADYWGGRKNAYVADTISGDTFAFGFAPPDIATLANVADKAGPGAARTYFPAAGAPVSGDGWQYRASILSASGDYAAYSVLWSSGVTRILVGPFTVIVPKDQWRTIKP